MENCGGVGRKVRVGEKGMTAGDGHMGGKSYFVDMVLESKCE